jgi:hypothetical protein
LVFVVSAGCLLCRDDFGDGGSCGGFVDEFLAGGAGGDEGGEGEVVDGAGFAAAGVVDEGEGVAGYLCLERIFAVFSQVRAVAFASVTVARGRARLVALLG